MIDRDIDQVTVQLDKDISNFVNRYGTDGSIYLAELMANDHPTLQQAKMRLFVWFVRDMARKQYTDARNEASVNLAIQLVNDWGDGPSLPLI